MATKVKKGLMTFILCILLLPLLQQGFQVIMSAPLNGGYVMAPDTVFSIPAWMNGSFQVKKEQYLNDNTGFRSDLVRVDNQVNFSLFNTCRAFWDLRGRDNMLFQIPYIDAYYGNDYVGYDTIREKTRKLKAIQDTMARLGKSLIIVYAPSKASFYPEFFPADRVQEKRSITNKDAYKQRADSIGLNQVDMDNWFVSLKNKSKELLFAKQCTHYTVYGCMLASDSLVKYVEQLRHIHMLHPDWSKIEHEDHARYQTGDDDIGSEINLIFPVAHETFAYPVITEVPDATAKKPNIVLVGDSFGLKIMGCGLVPMVTNQCELWCYFNQAMDINNHRYSDIPHYDWHTSMNNADCVILFYTSFNIKILGNGFIEQAYAYYYPRG